MVGLLAILGYMVLPGLATGAAEDTHIGSVMDAAVWALVHARQ